MKLLVIGSGGREHALAWKLAQSPRVTEVLVAPGNAGTAREPKCRNVAIAVGNVEGLLGLAENEAVALTLVGPEGPLTAGIVDRFRAAGQRIFGPTQAAAQLEGSKAFAKDFLARHRIPTGYYQVFDDAELALDHVRDIGPPIVIKADGLAAGKGVVVAMTLEDAEEAILGMLSGDAFGDAGSRVVIEEYLEGEEASFIAMVDGRTALPMATSQDHKRVHDGDHGPNTGGMGAYSPAPVVTPDVHARVMREIIEPTVRGMIADGHPFTGFLYAGLMIDADGAPKVIEFNVRFGDPETQPVMMRLRSDLAELIEAAIDGRLQDLTAEWDPRPALGVVMAAAEYPEAPRVGDLIDGLDSPLPPDTKIFHAGTREANGRVLTAGGRVLCACALGDSVADAQRKVYEAANRISWEGEFHRSDIGWRAIERERRHSSGAKDSRSPEAPCLLRLAQISERIERWNAFETARRRDYHAYLANHGDRQDDFEEHLRKYGHLIRTGQPTTPTELADMERVAGLSLPRELVEFYTCIGGLHDGGVCGGELYIPATSELLRHMHADTASYQRIRSPGLVDMMLASWGNDRPELEAAEGGLPAADAQALNTSYACIGWTCDSTYEARTYLYFDRAGRFGSLFCHQDEFDEIFEQALFPMLRESPARAMLSELLLQFLDDRLAAIEVNG